ncbi:aminotransferase class I/II-fold pyridoxal phosphate-dependent enzyme [Chlamydia gallinacea]|uniref:aminotransferase class I/II-fold pyridoxal phosphate-dependent enzyme n=1 Tax=Chlamydia gallinacea TaxID=1457153 RepID=UPI00255D0FF9|nr:aminotransferase class I/II-fold pyridoxal phosphate-dependent enzyme [Chlamydia gallinacea]
MCVSPIDFITNDFLGFARSTQLMYEVERRYRQYCQEFPYAKSGARGSRSTLGSPPVVHDLEEKIARFHNVEAAFVVNSGSIANFGLCYHITETTDMVFWDAGVHISVYSSLRVIVGNHKSFPNNDLDALESLLRAHRRLSSGRIFIFACSVYSCLGTVAPLEKLLILARKYDAFLIIDEAHALGLFGEEGRGLCHHWGYENFYAVLVTYGKAMGAVGAAILSSREIKTKLMNTVPLLCYTTAMAPHALLTIGAAYDHLLISGAEARNQLVQVQTYFSKRLGLRVVGGGVPMFFPDDVRKLLAAELKAAHVHVGMMNFVKQPCIRVNLHAYNTEDEIDILADKLNDYLEKCCHGVHIDCKPHF